MRTPFHEWTPSARRQFIITLLLAAFCFTVSCIATAGLWHWLLGMAVDSSRVSSLGRLCNTLSSVVLFFAAFRPFVGRKLSDIEEKMQK